MDDNKKFLKMLLPVVIIGVVMIVFSTIFTNSMEASIHDKKNNTKKEQSTEKKEEKPEDIISSIKMRIGDEEFVVEVDSGPAGQEFAKATPFEVDMKDLNGNEKYYTGKDKFENVNEISVGYIESGDIMLYGDDTIVIFYDNFKTEYKYTRLGRVDEKTRLIEALGRGDVTVMFTKS